MSETEPGAQRLELLEFAIEQANDGIAVMEFTDEAAVPVRIVYANAAIQRLSGYSREELLDPSNPFLRVQSQNRKLYARLFEDVRAGRPVRFEVELGGKDRSVWAEIRWSPLRYGGGAVTHYVAVLRDITERRRADAERELLSRAVEDSLDYITIYDATPEERGGPRLVYANEAFRHALGYRRTDELIGKSYRHFLAPDNDPRLAEHLAELIRSSQVIEKELRIQRRDGSMFWAECTAHPIRAEQMKDHWFVVARDISERKRTIRDMAIVTRAIDVLPFPVEVYCVEEREAVPIFRNQASEIACEAIRRERLARAFACAEQQAPQDDACVVPLYDSAGAAEAFVVFVPL